MFETLPQQPQHPEHFHQLLQQQSNLHFCNPAGTFTPYRAHVPSPLGLCNTNSLVPPATPIFSTMKKTYNDNNNHNDDGTADKENNNSSYTFGSNSPNQQNSGRNIFSFSPNPSSPISHHHHHPKQSTYEQRFKSGTSNNPLAKIFGDSQSSSTSSSSSSATAASRACKQRAIFLNKVKQDRENSRFNARGESVMMMEHVSEQKHWHEQMRQKADMIFHQYHLDEGELSDDDNNNNAGLGREMVVDSDQYVLDQLLSQEQEIDALLENMPENETTLSTTKSELSFSGDDDDMDYEDIFKEIVGSGQHQSPQDMDMSG